MLKMTIKGIFISFIFAQLVLITACNSGDPSSDQTRIFSDNGHSLTQENDVSLPLDSICAVTKDYVGQELLLIGTIGMIDRNNPEGTYADLKGDGCQIGIWVTKGQWNSWTENEQSIMISGNTVAVKGKINSFGGDLILELNSPISMETVSMAESSVLAPEIFGEDSTLEDIKLVQEPLIEKRLEVKKIYSGGDGPGLCYLGTYAMLAKHQDDNIDFSKVIANSGVATSAHYVPEINLLLNGFEIGSIAVAAKNQGFEYYIAALEGASLTDQFMAMNLVEDAKGVLSVEDEEAAFSLMKRLISSSKPVMVHLDIDYIREELVKYCPYWQEIFDWQDKNLKDVHIDHYMTVNGYDQEYVYLNDPTEKQQDLGRDIPIKIENFLESWKNGNHFSFADEARIGPYWMLFLGNRSKPKSVKDLLAWNKEIAIGAIQEIRDAADTPNVNELIHCNGMYRSRLEFATYLAENGYAQASHYFTEISGLFGGLMRSTSQGADIERIADLQEQSLGDW